MSENKHIMNIKINGSYGCLFNDENDEYPYWIMFQTTADTYTFWVFKNNPYHPVPNMLGKHVANKVDIDQLVLAEVETWDDLDGFFVASCEFQLFYTLHAIAEKMVRGIE